MRIPAKKTIPVLFFCFLMVSSLSGAVDLNDGFLGVKWGTSPAVLEEFTKIYEKSNIVYYMRVGMVPTINEQVIQKVIYGFYEDQFFSVHMMIEDIEAYESLRSYMQDEYGTPKIVQTASNPQTLYQWKSKKTKIKLKRHHASGEMKLSVYYTPVSSMVNEVLGEANQEKTVQFLPIERDKKPERMPLLTF